ncbi:MAG: hypothetical protein ALECFALPRED_000263 [Alectoria fallacina]|uniref:Uncharacterized protein n=1 Tax=Alectoria fallacina TaxID=1903189 RepID=A0A8H3J9U8_9LECA|nr:MAG: hypothetical protein ALECFALPRED_000263 [Alectoria fallacina]
MGIFNQPKVTPLPPVISLDGKTSIVTGAGAGMGLETARQLVALNVATVILAVRNTAKGEDCKASLLADPAVKKHWWHDRKPTVKVMKLDMDDYGSVQSFAKAIKAEVPIVDYLLLNAGIGNLRYKRSATGHERTMQVNYLSNVFLLLELLPLLEASAIKTGSPSRVTWVGSRTHSQSTLADRKKAVKPAETVIGHMDDRKYFFPFHRFNDTKLLGVMFLYELAPRLDRTKVIVNMVCPGMVDAAMSDGLPIYLRFPVNVVRAIRARTVEQGVWLILNAMVVMGPDSHGAFILDKDVQPRADFIESAAGEEVGKKLYSETMAEMRGYTDVPAGLLATA